ncbi:pyrroline-5-carboxylate reductase family protein [Pelagerythrobacter marensis]|uniref:Pyrroline-5-carboxylate reductase n=1 Tax=Pelagerythrobacter marensis TaxID=543877 RepID=A0A0G3XAQ9_9SPHN|nr:pyrroline-5-carboxylate reductase [Pelagerythrobacter marensis]AKM07483.1 pyrroline-5-carboxylate reductase [Pelagerythrobacter marensis]
MKTKNILMIGCGKMGGALLEHWMSGGDNFTIVDPALGQVPAPAQLVADAGELGENSYDVIVVAIKPQMIADIMPAHADRLAPGGYVLSIAAGCSAERISNAMNGAPVIRVMPNLPAAVGQGVSGICPAPGVGDDQRAHAEAMMARTGTAITVDSEDKLDRVTAVAGSGPGYVFEIARAYVAAAQDLGFSQEEARAMVLGTMAGTVAMAEADEDGDLETLRNSVTSKGGTTAAGLNALNGDETLTRLMRSTLQAAYDRAVELR